MAEAGSGLRMADPVLRFEKHATLGKNEATKKAFTRPWGSQPMNVDVKTGKFTCCAHPEQKPDMKMPEAPAQKAAELPVKMIPMKWAYGR